jgi:penicillin-binding protein 1A
MEIKKKFLLIGLSILLILSFVTIGYVEYIFKGFPVIDTLVDYKPNLVTRLYSTDGEIIGELYLERRLPAAKSIPEYVKKAFVAAEDADFYRHHGVSFSGILRAMLKNILAGDVIQGGSTITQQVTRSIILSPEKTFTRKIREIILAYRLEKALTKDEILALYLNQIYLGNNSYGIEAAAETYFHKPVKDLSLAEASFLAGMPKAPSRYNPFVNPVQLKERQKYVLNRMAEEQYITKEEAERAYREPVTFYKYKSPHRMYAYFVDAVKAFLSERFNEELLSTGGLKVYTSLNAGIQSAAYESVILGLRELDKRQGFRGALKQIDEKDFQDFLKSLLEEFSVPQDRVSISIAKDGEINVSPLKVNEFSKDKIYTGLVTAVDSKNKCVNISTGGGAGKLCIKDMEWAHKPDPEIDGTWVKVSDPASVLKVGDVVRVRIIDSKKDGFIFSLEQEPFSESALLALEGCKARAMVGGYDYSRSQFNRAIQAKRQPGSAIKPLLYGSAVDKGYTPSSLLLDAPITFTDSEDWKPHNYEESFSGPILFRNALIVSKNNPTVRLLWDVGIDYFTEYLKHLGIEEPKEKNLSLALGSLSVSLKELVLAYNVFASGGKLCPDIVLVEKVEDWKGRLVYDYTMDEKLNTSTQVITPQNAYIMTHIMKGVVEEGTGWRAKALNRPSAGKTGTTDEYRDAWYIGYTPDIIAGVWVGNDNFSSLGRGEAGARAASPIWVNFMLKVINNYPPNDFTVPEGIVFAKIDPETGLLATDSTKEPVFEAYIEGTEPKEYSVDHKKEMYLK